MDESGRAGRWWIVATIGAGVVAVCYGFARYAYGLFAPQIGADVGLSAGGVGVLAGLSTAGYAVGLLVAPRVAARSPRAATLLAGLLAAGGLAVMAVSSSVVVLAAGLVVAGSSAGMVSPAVAQLIVDRVAPGARVPAQTWANSGTSLGLAASAFTPALAAGWHLVWLGFAAVAVAMTLVAARVVRAARTASSAPEPAADVVVETRSRPAGLTALLVNSALIGLTSAPYWTFSSTRVTEAGLGSTAATWCWFAIGIVGPVGGLAGAASERFGLRATNLAVWTLWAASFAVLALPGLGLAAALGSAAAFGLAYMALTGLCIVWGARLFPQRPAHGVMVSFFALGIGQTIGSPLAGVLADGIGLAGVFAVTAAVSLVAWTQLRPSLAPVEPAVVDEPELVTR